MANISKKESDKDYEERKANNWNRPHTMLPPKNHSELLENSRLAALGALSLLKRFEL